MRLAELTWGHPLLVPSGPGNLTEGEQAVATEACFRVWSRPLHTSWTDSQLLCLQNNGMYFADFIFCFRTYDLSSYWFLAPLVASERHSFSWNKPALHQ